MSTYGSKGSLASMAFSIDQHYMTVLEADGVDVEPRITQRLVVGVGQACSLSTATLFLFQLHVVLAI